ncbi:unnamed protein product [Hymenolepis diminuta]|uniref:Uncharacterized protein n=1 Tax=Hymenolepis diminuta TaxID=6216 RepID=A0A564ZCH6_HYMDI|nr:unnamed protein product [Hymenolepis diminuta]
MLEYYMYLSVVGREAKDIHKYTSISHRPACYAGNHLKFLFILNKNLSALLLNLMDAYNNFRNPIADSNLIEIHETRTCLIKKPSDTADIFQYPKF